MAKYLSDGWLEDFQRLSQDLPTIPGVSARVQYHIADVPGGDVEYYWIFEDGRMIDGGLGKLPDAEYSITMEYKDALSISKGEVDPAAAFMQGKMKVDGNVAKLMTLMPLTTSPEWAELQQKLRAVTEH